MTRSADSVPSLPTQRAFVVQFSAQTHVALGQFTGRLEHIVTGHARRFQSLDDLVAGLMQMLAALGTTPPAEGEDTGCPLT